MLLIVSLIPAAVLTTLSFFVFYAVDRGTKSQGLCRFGRALGVGILVVVVILLTTTTLITAHGQGDFSCEILSQGDDDYEDEKSGMQRRMERMDQAMHYMQMRAELENKLAVLSKSNPKLAAQMRDELEPILER